MCNFNKSLVFFFLTICAIAHAVLGASINIIGGEEAGEDEFPFLVTIQYKGANGENNTHNCGGTLISMTRVITAAHCVAGTPKESLTVVGGTHLLSSAVRGLLQNRDVSNIVIHPNYEGGSINKNDIAIVDLSTPFENPRIGSIPMPSRWQTSSGQCLIAGWGFTEQVVYSDKLIKGRVTVHSKEQCSTSYPVLFDPDRQICAGNLNGETADMCPGDTGGGIYCYNSEGMYFAGVASWGFGCGTAGRPGVFMEVAQYLNWINSVNGGPNYSTTTVSSSPTTTTTSPLEGENDGANDNGDVSSAENHKPIVPCKVRK
ncbi:unnamed protein product [Orchesella dallaii]|uniref:Peptidase S1 domain-containing protein n=1 Tax=Orchesella dallaii TaxID=48710 RepID=A0ABP1Q9Q6_9HEXA